VSHSDGFVSNLGRSCFTEKATTILPDIQKSAGF